MCLTSGWVGGWVGGWDFTGLKVAVENLTQAVGVG